MIETEYEKGRRDAIQSIKDKLAEVLKEDIKGDELLVEIVCILREAK